MLCWVYIVHYAAYAYKSYKSHIYIIIYIMCSRVKLKDGVGTKMWSPKRCQWSWNMLELGPGTDPAGFSTWNYLNPSAFTKWQLLNFAKHIERHELDILNGKQCKTSCKWSVAADDWICSAGAARDIKSEWRLQHGHPQTHPTDVLKIPQTSRNPQIIVIKHPFTKIIHVFIQDH